MTDPKENEQVFVEFLLVWGRRHLRRRDRRLHHSGFFIVRRWMVTQEFLNDLCLPHTGIAKNQQRWHSTPRGVGEQIRKLCQDLFSFRVIDPAVMFYPLDPFSVFLWLRSPGVTAANG
jgi:hypothetical protein